MFLKVFAMGKAKFLLGKHSRKKLIMCTGRYLPSHSAVFTQAPLPDAAHLPAIAISFLFSIIN